MLMLLFNFMLLGCIPCLQFRMFVSPLNFSVYTFVGSTPFTHYTFVCSTPVHIRCFESCIVELLLSSVIIYAQSQYYIIGKLHERSMTRMLNCKLKMLKSLSSFLSGFALTISIFLKTSLFPAFVAGFTRVLTLQR